MADRVELHHPKLDHTVRVLPRQVEHFKSLGYKPVPKSRKADPGDKEK